MYATKRKFHNLLSSLSANGSSTGPSKDDTTPSTEVESQAKKRRVLEPYSALLTAERRPRPKETTPASIRSVNARQSTPSTAGPAILPNFAPWDRNQFLERLKTFRHVDKWSSKPPRINEVQWARRGWTCVGKERVGCVGGCGKEVCIKLEDTVERSVEDDENNHWATGAEEQLVERYASLIITEHDEDCLWRKRGCNEDIYRLPLNHPSSSIAALKSRYQSIVAMGVDIPSNIRHPDRLDVGSVVETLPSDFGHSESSTVDDDQDAAVAGHVNQHAVILALFGWQAESGHVSGLLTCSTCFRRLGLWLFAKRPRTSATADTAESGDEALLTALDVTNEHREYCPWINAATQSGHLDPTKPSVRPDDKAGWEILVRVLSTDHHFRMRSNTTRPESQRRILPADQTADNAAEPESTTANTLPVDDASIRDQKDKERWAKLRKLKKVFDVKNRKSKKEKP